MKIAVYTTIFGGYTPLRILPPQTVPAEYFCITDIPSNLSVNSDHSDPNKSVKWTVIETGIPRWDLVDRLKAKFFKMFPWEIEDLKSFDVWIYIDGSIQVTSDKFVEYCVKHLKGDICLFKHPDRNCIFQEANASVDLVKYKNENINGQMAFYHTFFPTDKGLYACGIVVRKSSAKIKDLMQKWWWEQIKFTYQDQLSFPVVCDEMGIVPDIFPDHQYKNPYLRIHWKDDNPPANNTTTTKKSQPTKTGNKSKWKNLPHSQ